jgi:mannose-1-phosphate guanylyltransferase
MKALILAAGKGTRVMPLTRNCPKPMLRILDTPVLELLINQLRKHGVTQIMINTSHHAAAIQDYFGDGRRFGVELAYSFEGQLIDGELIGDPVGSAAAIRCIHEHAGFFDDTFLVLCGDAVVDIDFSQLVEHHHRARAIASIALHEVAPADVIHYGVVVTDADGLATSFQEKPSQEEALGTQVNTGIYVFEPRVLNYIPATVPYDLGGQVFPDLVKRGLPVLGVCMPMTWLDIGRLSDYHRVCMMAIRGKVPGYTLPGREVLPGLRCGINVHIHPKRVEISGPVVISGGAHIADGATLVGPCFIGAGAKVEQGARIEASVVMPHARIGANAHVNDMVTDGRYCMLADGTVLDLAKADIPWVVGDVRMPRESLLAAEQRYLDSIG